MSEVPLFTPPAPVEKRTPFLMERGVGIEGRALRVNTNTTTMIDIAWREGHSMLKLHYFQNLSKEGGFDWWSVGCKIMRRGQLQSLSAGYRGIWPIKNAPP